MAAETSIITVRVKNDTKRLAMENAEAVGIPLSTLINAFLVKFAAEGVVPFEIGVPCTPNAVTRSAMREAREGRATRCASIADMYAKSGIDKPGHA